MPSGGLGGFGAGLAAGASGGAGGLAGALGIPSGPPNVAGALQGLVPSPQSVLSKATGGLSDVRSVQDLMKYLTGAITRGVEKRQMRTVGGAYIVLAGESISHDGQKALAEVVGGLKLTVAAKDSIAQTVGQYCATTVGGVVLKKAKGDITIGTRKNTVKVGGFANLESEEKIELRGEEIELVATQSFSMKCGDLQLLLEPSGITMKGIVRLDAATKIQVFGQPDDLTGK